MFENIEANFLLKFVESQFAESTLDGKFYFSRNRQFIDLEEQQIDKGIGDKREGVWSKALHPKTEEMFIILEDGKELPLHFKKAVFRQSYEDLKDLPICCFVLLNLKEDFIIEDENKLIIKPELEQKLAEQFDGRDLIFFTDTDEIIKRFDDACKKDNLNRMRGKVKYYDDEVESHPLSDEDFEADPSRTLLYKRKFFEFQKEFRIVIKKPFKNDLILDVGNTRDIAYNLGKVEQGKIPLELMFRHSNQQSEDN